MYQQRMTDAFFTSVEQMTTPDLMVQCRLGQVATLACDLEMAHRVDFRAMLAREQAQQRIQQEYLCPITPADHVLEELNAGGTVREFEEQLAGEVLA